MALGCVSQQVKGRSARAINRQRGRSGPLWQKERFDRLIRSEKEYQEKRDYILNNAVKAGLVEEAERYDGLWIGE